MIIGISGKIKSGKDTVGEIIQCLCTGARNRKDVSIVDEFFMEQWVLQKSKIPNMHYDQDDWKIKKYADKLKDIVCLLIGCTRKQLEDREFKEKELGEEWIYFRKCLSIMHFDSRNPYAIKGALFSSFKEAEESWVDIPPKHDVIASGVIKEVLTPRKLLQLLGTEAGRQIIHPNIWVNALMSDYKRVGTSIGSTSDEDQPIYPNWIITDMRFPNELDAVKAKKGITIRINRPETDHLAGDHASETALDNAKFDYVVDNVGSIQDLIDKIKEILVNENLL